VHVQKANGWINELATTFALVARHCRAFLEVSQPSKAAAPLQSRNLAGHNGNPPRYGYPSTALKVQDATDTRQNSSRH
jgi:hypothetical protein